MTDALVGGDRARRRLPARVASVVLLTVTACSTSADTGSNATPSGPSGALGVVRLPAAREAVTTLCRIKTDEGLDRETANGAFYDQAHQTLHVIAAAVEVRDRTAAAELQVAKQRVEQDLLDDPLPASFTADVEALVRTTRRALSAVRIDVPGCRP
jgi:hypothetical protein